MADTCANTAPAARAIVFINGFHRSGTTVVTAALTEAMRARTTTVADLARHIPSLGQLLASLDTNRLDRGVDRLEVSASMPEEYGHLLHHLTGQHSLYGDDRNVSLLRTHIAELCAAGQTAAVVLKNPWDIGQEARMLVDFPEAKILLLRRDLADIERSVLHAITRVLSSSKYMLALSGEQQGDRFFERLLASKSWKRVLLLWIFRWQLRLRVFGLVRAAPTLPLERVAFVSYDELRANPQAGATWASHLVDPDLLARAFAKHAFPERRPAEVRSWMTMAFDRLWARAWARARAAQVQACVLASPQ